MMLSYPFKVSKNLQGWYAVREVEDSREEYLCSDNIWRENCSGYNYHYIDIDSVVEQLAIDSMVPNKTFTIVQHH